MSARTLYPLSENAPDLIVTPTGKPLHDITVDGILSGDVTAADLAITPEALKLQADIARSANRPNLASNFERAAELVGIPQDLLLETYGLLRPGRASSAEVLRARAELFRDHYAAPHTADLIDEAAEVYQRRGLFTVKRY